VSPYWSVAYRLVQADLVALRQQVVRPVGVAPAAVLLDQEEDLVVLALGFVFH
jgi:hypothetical protein